MKIIAQGLKELGIQLDLVLTSPYLRASQTAQILAKKFDLKKGRVVVTEQLVPTGHADQLVEEINQKYGNVQNIAIIGHEPYLGNFAAMLVTGNPNTAITLKKGGICRLSIEKIQYNRCAILEWLLSPAQLVEIGK